MEAERYAPAIVIATRDRPEHLLTTVKTVVDQTLLPGELCIVDSSDRTPTRAAIEKLCAQVGLRLDYHHTEVRGSCHQRNLGIDRTTGDPVIFMDDDVSLEPDCIEQLVAEYGHWGADLGGVSGTDAEPSRVETDFPLWRKLFGLSSWTRDASGRIKAGFYVDGISEAKAAQPVQYMNGWLMSFRRHALNGERFDEAMPGYAQKENIDLAYRISRRYLLVKTPDARGRHHKTGTSRLTKHELFRVIMANQFYLHRKNMPRALKYRLALSWALVGLFLLNIGKAARYRDLGYVTGMVVGAWEQVRGRGPVDPVGEQLEHTSRVESPTGVSTDGS
jgi:glycosyltransferase involved in cell wall biosynthesis